MEYLLFLKAVLNIILYSRLLYILLVISKLRQLNMRRHAHNLETPDCGERPTIWLILITWWHEFSVFSTVSSKFWPVFLFFYGIFFLCQASNLANPDYGERPHTAEVPGRGAQEPPSWLAPELACYKVSQKLNQICKELPEFLRKLFAHASGCIIFPPSI